MKYLWTEDTGAGLHFWKLINQLFFDDELTIESKESNQGILDALSDLEIKADDKYYIAFDKLVTWTGTGRQIKSRFVKMFCRQLRNIESTCQRFMTRRLYSIWLVLRDILQSE